MKASDIQTIQNFAKKKKRFIIEKLSELSVSHIIANKYLAKAIACSTSLRTVHFENLYFTPKHWKVICDGVLNNNSIEFLVFNRMLDMDDETLEIVGQIFEQKKIRFVHLTQLSAKPQIMAKFASYIANSNTVERITMSHIASYSSTDYLFGCLRNKLVTRFTIRQSAITANQFQFLARCINNSNITHLHLGLQMPEVDLTPIISASNSVTKLTLNNNIRTVNEATLLINAMKRNTRIESLKFIFDSPPEDPTNFAEQIYSLLALTKTLKRISFVDRSQTQHAINGIIMNTSLTALDMTVMTADLYDLLCEAILNHPTIEKVKIRSVQSPNHLTSLKLICNSKTLADIDISDSENLDENILKLICQSMTTRQMLRRIRMTLDTVSLANNDLFWQTLMNCTSLSCVEIDNSCSKPFSPAIWSKFGQVLEKNREITSLGKFNDAPDKITQLLDSNKKRQLYGASYAKMFVSMLAKRSDSFTEKLPLEIWVMILKKIRYNSVNVKFDELLLKMLG